MSRDAKLREDVLAELRWERRSRGEDVTVAVQEGVVTLVGTVESYVQRHVRERAGERVNGVRTIVNDLAVKRPAAASIMR